jgi:hypothetical protein
MITVRKELKMIIVRGIYRVADIERAVLKATGGKRWDRRGDWILVGLADDDARGINTGLPFTPPDSTDGIGYRLPSQP